MPVWNHFKSVQIFAQKFRQSQGLPVPSPETITDQRITDAIQAMRVFLRVWGVFVLFFPLFCSLDKILKVILMICTSDKYFGTEEVFSV